MAHKTAQNIASNVFPPRAEERLLTHGVRLKPIKRNIWAVGEENIVYKASREFPCDVQIFNLSPYDQLEDSIYNRAVESRQDLLSLKHPNLIKVLGLIFDETLGEEHRRAFLYTERYYADLYTVVDEKGRFTGLYFKSMAWQLIDGLSYMHERNIFHRDLTIFDVVYDWRLKPKINDFGFVSYFRVHQPRHHQFRSDVFIGTIGYVDPEVIRTVLHNTQHPNDKRTYSLPDADCWMLGCVLYFMCQGIPPFISEHEMTEQQYYEMARNMEYDFHAPIGSHLGIELIMHLLQAQPINRFNLEMCKAHPFFAGMDPVIRYPGRDEVESYGYNNGNDQDPDPSPEPILPHDYRPRTKSKKRRSRRSGGNDGGGGGHGGNGGNNSSDSSGSSSSDNKSSKKRSKKGGSDTQNKSPPPPKDPPQTTTAAGNSPGNGGSPSKTTTVHTPSKRRTSKDHPKTRSLPGTSTTAPFNIHQLARMGGKKKVKHAGKGKVTDDHGKHKNPSEKRPRDDDHDDNGGHRQKSANVAH